MMNKRTVNGVFQKDRLRKSFSKKRISLQNLKQTVPASPKHQKELVVDYEVPLLKQVMQNVQRQVLKPIYFHEDVFNSANLPKCLLHNNILTLYCKNDSKPLCAGCLYASQAHKPHKVIPLVKAGAEIKESLSENILIAKKNIQTLQELIKKNDENLAKSEKEYPQMIDKLHNFYLHLHETLADRKNEQLETMAQNWARLRYSYHLTKVELQKIVTFIKSRLEAINQKSPKETLLFFRNITLQMVKIKDIVPAELGKGEQNRFINDIKNFAEVAAVIQKHLVFTNVYSLEKELMEIKNKKKKTSNPQTPTRHDNKNQPSKFFFKDSPRANLNDTQTDQKSIDLSKNGARSLTRNRHSKSDLLKKQQVEESLRMKSATEIKKKNGQLHSLILQKSRKAIFKKELSKVSPGKKDKKNKSQSKSFR